MKIYLTRHGQTTGDIENRYGGDYDDHLTNLGKRQSKQLAKQLVNKNIELLFTSPRIRAQETASIVADALNITPSVLNNFRERNGYGVLTGMTKEEALQQYPAQVKLLGDVRASVEGAEEYQPFQQRITEALDVLSQENAETVAVVTHGGPIRLLFRDVLGLGEINVDDCAYVLIEAKQGKYHLIKKHGITIR